MPVGNLFVTHKLSFFRTLVTWEATGSYGRYDGHNTVTWKSGKWIRKGITLNIIQIFVSKLL